MHFICIATTGILPRNINIYTKYTFTVENKLYTLFHTYSISYTLCNVHSRYESIGIPMKKMMLIMKMTE